MWGSYRDSYILVEEKFELNENKKGILIKIKIIIFI
jgi:hypothetical protein